MSKNPIYRDKNNTVLNIFVYFLLAILAILMLLPVIYMVSTSLKNDRELFAFPPTIIPEAFAWHNYIDIFKTLDLIGFYKNSLIVAIASTVGTVLSSSMVAFGFARYRARAKNFLFFIIISTLMLPYPALIIPQFLVFRSLGWINTFLPLTVPAFFGSAYSIFLLRQFFTTVPNELFEAARVDGCSELRTWLRIALPLCKSALATVGIFAFIWSWNDLLTPVIYLNTEKLYTLPIALTGLYSPVRVKIPWNTIMVGNVFALLPLMLLFWRAQKYFTEGIAISGLK